MLPLSKLLFRLFVWLAAACVMVGSFSTPLWADLPAKTSAEPRPILVGTAIDSYPKSFVGSSGRCEGFIVDLTEAVARVMDIKIETVKGTSGELKRRFENGEFDMLAAYSPGPGRELLADFSNAYLVLNGAIFVRKDHPQIRTLKDLNGVTLALSSRGSVADQLIQDFQLKPRNVVYSASTEEAMHLLDAGEIDAAFATRLAALSVIDRDHLKNIRTLETPITGYDLYQCFAVHKGDLALLNRLNEGLAILHQTGQFDRIYTRWFGHFDSSMMTRQQAITYAALVLGLALALAIVGLLHQRALRRRLAGQAALLAENESILAEAQRIAHVGHWRFDSATRTLTCSPEMLRLLDRTNEQSSLGYYRLLSLIPKSDRAVVHRAARDALRSGFGGELIVSIYPRPDLRRVLNVKFQVARNPATLAISLVGTIQDITQQKVFEEDLRAREQLLRAIYNNVPSALGVVETAGDTFRFISANPGTAKLLGLDPQVPLAGQLLSGLKIPTNVSNFWLQWFQRGVDQGEILKAEPELEQNRSHFSLTLIPLGFGPSGHAQLCFLAEDVSERKQIDAEIAQGRRLRAVGELVGGIAHEFNNLLTPILLKSELLRVEWSNELRLMEELRTISRAAERGADLTKRLLAFGRRAEPQPEVLKLRAIVDANVDLLQPTIDRRIQLVSDVPDTLPDLFLNPSDLHQIILNLLLNARDTLIDKLNQNPAESWRACIRAEAAQFGPRAIESTHWEKSDSPLAWLCLTIRDNGMGMPQHVLERIFEPFYTTKGVGKGTGLGLATVWHLVTRMGGKVNVQSRVGEGTAFQIWLPVLPRAQAPRPAAVERLADPTAAGVRICLVEDDDMVAQTVSMTLRRQQHHVVHFRHGGDAWRHLSTRSIDYDLLLLDLDLPGISGLEIARRARASRYGGKILVASGRLSENESRELERLGVDFQLEKPFSPPKLNLAVQTCMAARKSSLS